MNLYPNSQTNLYGLQDNLLFFAKLFDQKRLPSKILLTGQKGIGKCTLAYHLINLVLSKDEEMPYNFIKFKIPFYLKIWFFSICCVTFSLTRQMQQASYKLPVQNLCFQ